MTTLNSEQLREIRRIYGSNSSVAECREIYESLRREALRGSLDQRGENLTVELDMVVWKQEWKRGEKMWLEVAA